jgi:hypothetical protein
MRRAKLAAVRTAAKSSRDTAVLECLLRLRQCCLARTLIAPERLARAKAALVDMDRLVDDTASKVHLVHSHLYDCCMARALVRGGAGHAELVAAAKSTSY